MGNARKNLSVALLACANTRKAMSVGAGNRPQDHLLKTDNLVPIVTGLVVPGGGVTTAMGLLKGLSDWGAAKQCVQTMRADKVPGQGLAWIQTVADKAGKSGCGNCGEHAAVAFMELMRLRDKSPVDYIQYPRNAGDHAFVVIGRQEQSDVADATTWGPDAVVCDAWAHKAYEASLYSQEMRSRLAYVPELIHREK